MGSLVTVIVPVYNVEQYLRKCVDSILAQTYPNIEVILVDDGSPDQCPAICDEYAKCDKRVVVIHKENGGVSSARNIGLDKMTGEYFTFIDADDYVELDYISVLVNALEASELDLVRVECYHEDIYGTYLHNYLYTIKDEVIFREQFDLKRLFLYSNVWGKLFRGSLLAHNKNNFRFRKDIHIMEDLLFVMTYYLQGNGMIVLAQPKYHYVRQPQSITMSGFSKKHFSCVLVWQEIINLLINDIYNQKLAEQYCAATAFDLLLQSASKVEKNLYLDEKKRLLLSIRRYLFEYINIKNSLRHKFLYCCYAAFPRLSESVVRKRHVQKSTKY